MKESSGTLAVYGLLVWIVFGLSFVAPLLIGIYFQNKYFDYRPGRLIGIFSIILGAIIGVINMGISIRYGWNFVGDEWWISFNITMLALLFVPIFAFGTIKILRQKEKNQKWKPYAVVVPIALGLIVSITLIGSTYFTITRIYPESNYYIKVSTSSSNSYFMYISAPLIDENISEIVNYFEKLSGNVNVSVVGTLYGQALNLSAQGSFEVNAAKVGVEVAFSDLSLLNSSSYGLYLVYYNTSSSDMITLNLSGYCKSGIEWFSISLDQSITETGWNNLEGDYVTAVA